MGKIVSVYEHFDLRTTFRNELSSWTEVWLYLERFTRQPLHPHNTHPNAGLLAHCYCSGYWPSSFFYVATTLVIPLWNVVWLWPAETAPGVNTNIPGEREGEKKNRKRTSDGRAPTEGRAGVRNPPPPPQNHHVVQPYAGLPRDDEVISNQSTVRPWRETENSTLRMRNITTITFILAQTVGGFTTM